MALSVNMNITYLMFVTPLPVSPNLFLQSAQCIALLHFHLSQSKHKVGEVRVVVQNSLLNSLGVGPTHQIVCSVRLECQRSLSLSELTQ